MSWDEYYEKRKKNIRSQVRISDVLTYYGVDIRTVHREYQYPCPLHGDGQDDSYSARMFPDNFDGSGSTYCWACHKARDIFQWVMDKESLSFGKALSFMERVFEVTNIPPPPYDSFQEEDRERPSLSKEDKSETSEAEMLYQAIDQVDKTLRMQVRRGDSPPMEKTITMFYILDALVYRLQREQVSVQDGKETLAAVYQKIRG